MFNVTIIKLKDIVKIGIILILIYVFCKLMFKNVSIKDYFNQNISFNKNELTWVGINSESNIIKNVLKYSQKEDEERTEDMENMGLFDLSSILKTGDNVFTAKELKEDVGQDKSVALVENDDAVDNENIKTSSSNEVITDAPTQIVTENPIAESYNREYNGVKIKNETDFELTDDILNPEGLDINTKNIIIFHTHTCESYTESENYRYTATGNYRTTDLNYSVARVGDELSNYLSGYGFLVEHNKTFHDYPAYTGSYTRSRSTVENILKNFNSDIIIDLHRDAIGSKESYAPLIKIGDDYCAQIMFVMGTNGGGLYHPNWQSNLKFAVKIQEKANEIYPGLFKPIVLRNSRYNQHLGKAACIIEVGATGNTLDQTLSSMKYLSKVMEEVLK